MNLLHGFGRDERAWSIYSGLESEPAYPPSSKGMTRKEIELQVRLAPENTTHLVELARSFEEAGEIPQAREIILTAAGREHVPAWFLRKAAYLLAADGQIREAVAMALREE